MKDPLEVNAFSLHHVLYKSPDFIKTFDCTKRFMPSFNERGAKWFQTNEQLELLCRPCHALEHAINVKGDSEWQRYHNQMIELLGGVCLGCGLSFEKVGLGKIFHIHHNCFDGKQQRLRATEEIDESSKEVSGAVNEYKLILDMKGEELEEKLSTLELLCEGCHYFEHMDKHARSEIIDKGMKEKVLDLFCFQRLLQDK